MSFTPFEKNGRLTLQDIRYQFGTCADIFPFRRRRAVLDGSNYDFCRAMLNGGGGTRRRQIDRTETLLMTTNHSARGRRSAGDVASEFAGGSEPSTHRLVSLRFSVTMDGNDVIPGGRRISLGGAATTSLAPMRRT